jgi:hypothetical protein
MRWRWQCSQWNWKEVRKGIITVKWRRRWGEWLCGEVVVQLEDVKVTGDLSQTNVRD